jgi:transcriptional regulator with XRE-family HTH domain
MLVGGSSNLRGEPDMTFAEKLRELRQARGLSEAKLAQSSGVPFGTLHTYVLGSRTPSFPYVVMLAKALDVTCDEFADCDDVQAEAPPTVPTVRKVAARAASPKKGKK